MKNSKGLTLAIFAILFVLFNMIVLPFAFFVQVSAVYWITYVFTLIAFGLTSYVVYTKVSSDIPLNEKFLELPLVIVAYRYLILQLILAGVLISISIVQPKLLVIPLSLLALIGSSLLLGYALIKLLLTKTAINEVTRIEDKVKVKVDYIKTLQIEVEIMVTKTINPSSKKALQDLVSVIRFSDPMSHPSLAGIESAIQAMIQEISLKINDSDEVLRLVTEVTILFKERNLKSKVLK